MSQNGLPDLPDEKDVKKRQMVIVGIILLAIIAILFYAYATNPQTQLADSNQQQPIVTVDVTTPGKSNDPIQNWVLQNELKMQQYEDQNKREREETGLLVNKMLAEIRKLTEENKSLTAGEPLKDIPLPPLSSLPTNQPEVLPLGELSNTESESTGKALIDKISMTPESTKRFVKIKFGKKGKTKKPHIRDTIPAGSFGQAVLLSGLDAPTGGLAERDPHPVLLELVDNGNLPNRYRHRVRNCRVVGSGRGNISDERAYIRLERLTCVLNNGEIISKEATGTVVGEDGKNGLRGELVTKQGQLIANAFLAGSLSGLGQAISQSYTTVSTSADGSVSTLDPDKLVEAGLSSGLSNTMEKIADWYFKRAEEIYPIIEISAGRYVDLFLTEDLELGANLLAHYTPAAASD